MVSKIKIIIAEDQTILRKALVAYLQRSSGIEVLGDTSDAKQLLNLIKKQISSIVLLDLNLPVINGLDTIDVIKTRFPQVKLIVLSNSIDSNTLVRLIAIKVNGFISKKDDLETLIEAIHNVNKGIPVFNKIILAQVENGEIKFNKKADAISNREMHFVKEICNGLSNHQISKRLHISESTVNFHKRNIYRKTQSKHAVDLLRFAYKHKLIGL
jgi:DNA-binding NarL/FixJ family response regulator